MMDTALIDMPMPILTDRLMIREPQMGAGVVVSAAIAESFAELTRWMPWAREMPSVMDTEKWVREALSKFVVRRDMGLLIWNRDQTQFFGSTGLHPVTWSPRVFEIGYWIRTGQAGNGICTESVRAVAAYAFKTLKADRLTIRCDDLNTASARVAEKASFTLEGVMRHDCYNNAGELRDTRLYARLA